MLTTLSIILGTLALGVLASGLERWLHRKTSEPTFPWWGRLVVSVGLFATALLTYPPNPPPQHFGAKIDRVTEADDSTIAPQGARVIEVFKNGPAERAGLLKGDIILAINGEPVSYYDEAVVMVASLEPGENARLRIKRGGDFLEIQVKIGSNSGSNLSRASVQFFVLSPRVS